MLNLPMEIKGLLEKIRQKEAGKREPFFALQLDQEVVKSALWTVEEGMAKILAIGEGQTWKEGEELLEVVDASISSAIEKLTLLGKESEPKKVIFGLPSDWIEGSKITPVKLEILKKISKELGLSPVGFVVIPEAIVHHLKTTEGIPPTAILIGLGEKKLTVTLAKLGKIIGTELVDRSGQLGEDLAEGLLRFGSQEVFPARILLYNLGENLEEEKQQLMDYSWSEGGINFLHLPKVEILPADFDVKAVALAGGREVAKAEGIQVEITEVPEAEPEPGLEAEIEAETETMGFLKGKDITLEKPPKEEVVPEELEEKEILPKASFLQKLNLSRVKDFLSLIPQPKFGGKSAFIAGIIILAVLLLGGVLIASYWYLPKATVVLAVKPQILEKDFTIKLDPSLNAIDKEALALPGVLVKTEVEGESSRSTTGTKMIGDPAKGEVTIYNRTDKEKAFSQGTEINGPNNLKFSLDESVIVASESAGPDYVSLPGKAKVKVTARAIGTEGNLASGTEFSVSNLSRSDFIAKNEEALNGGTSRDVQVVDAKDQEKLLEEVSDQLKAKALDELGKTAPPGRKIVTDSLTSKIVEKNFSQNVGQEAAELKLHLKTESTVLGYSEEELRSLLQDKIKEAIPPGFEYRPEEEETSFSLKKVTKEDVAIFDIHLKAKLVLQLDLEKMKKDLAGKYPDLARQYLGNLPNIAASEITIKPPLPRQIATLPRLAKNIKIEVRLE